MMYNWIYIICNILISLYGLSGGSWFTFTLSFKWVPNKGENDKCATPIRNHSCSGLTLNVLAIVIHFLERGIYSCGICYMYHQPFKQARSSYPYSCSAKPLNKRNWDHQIMCIGKSKQIAKLKQGPFVRNPHWNRSCICIIYNCIYLHIECDGVSSYLTK